MKKKRMIDMTFKGDMWNFWYQHLLPLQFHGLLSKKWAGPTSHFRGVCCLCKEQCQLQICCQKHNRLGVGGVSTKYPWFPVNVHFFFPCDISQTRRCFKKERGSHNAYMYTCNIIFCNFFFTGSLVFIH